MVAGVPCSVTEEMNEVLNGEYTKEEVVTTLNQMEPLKASGLDGFPPLCFQHYWPTMGADVTEVVLSCLASGVIPPSINQTFITLIPKEKSPTKVFEYRPISLCNIIFLSLYQR